MDKYCRFDVKFSHRLFSALLLLILLACGHLFAVTAAWDADVDNDWFNADNWVGVTPSETVYGGVDYVASEVYPVLDGSVDPYEFQGLRLCPGNVGPAGKTITTDINAGTVILHDYAKIIVRNAGQIGQLNMNGGKLIVNGKFHIAWTGTGILQVNGGEIEVEDLVMSDGAASVAAITNIHGGQLYAGHLVMRYDNYSIDLQNDGVFIVPNEDFEYATIQRILDEGALTAYNGDGNLNVEFTEPNIIITAYPYNADQARNPSPALLSELDVLYETGPIELSWAKGDAATAHHIYVSTDYDLVNNSDPLAYQGMQNAGDETYDFYGAASIGDTVFWKINEQTPSGMVEGVVWSFSINDEAIIEDFESGIGSWTTAGSAVTAVDPNNMIDDIAIKVEFDGAGSVSKVLSPTVNLSSGGIEAIALMYHGMPNPATDATDMYVSLTDTSAYTKKVNYTGDPGDLMQAEWEAWKQWNLALADFDDGTLDLTNIAKITIGFDSGTGSVTFDDIAAYARRCVSELAAAGDFNNDCMVNNLDVAILGQQWLDSAYSVSPEAITDIPVVHYTFDDYIGDTVVNSSTYGADPDIYDGLKTSNGTAVLASGGYDNGGCLHLNTGTGKVLVPIEVFDANEVSASAVSISVWANLDEASLEEDSSLFVGLSSANQNIFNAYTPYITGFMRVRFIGGSNEIAGEGEINRGPDSYVNTWNHYVFVKDIDSNLLRIYVNGNLVAETAGASSSFEEIVTFTLGASLSGAQRMIGKIDDFRLYQYPLTWGQVLTLYGATEPLYVPVDSETDIVDDDIVNTDDLAQFGLDWLDDGMFPGL